MESGGEYLVKTGGGLYNGFLFVFLLLFPDSKKFDFSSISNVGTSGKP